MIAAHFESGLSFHGREYPMQMLFGPGTPLAKLKRDRAALEELIGAEIAAPASGPEPTAKTSSPPSSAPATRTGTRSTTGRSSTT